MVSREANGKIFVGRFVDRKEEALANQVFIEKFILSEAKSIDSNAESKNKESALSSSLESKRLKTQPSNQAAMLRKTGWLETYSSNYAKEMLIKILDGQVLIFQQHWSIGKILATLVHHQENKRLWSHYYQFKQFAYHIILIENNKNSRHWPECLIQRNWNLIIYIQAKIKIEK